MRVLTILISDSLVSICCCDMPWRPASKETWMLHIQTRMYCNTVPGTCCISAKRPCWPEEGLDFILSKPALWMHIFTPWTQNICPNKLCLKGFFFFFKVGFNILEAYKLFLLKLANTLKLYEISSAPFRHHFYPLTHSRNVQAWTSNTWLLG